AQRHHPFRRLCARPGRGPRLLRRQARHGGHGRRRPRRHALAHGRRPGPAGARDPPGEAGPARPRRRHRRAGPRARDEGGDGPGLHPHHGRLPAHVRGAQGQGRGVHAGARGALLRHRRRAARSVRQPPSDHAARAAAPADARGGLRRGRAHRHGPV
ncbi:MAG: Lactoylglutathione lyase and related lyases, partial [uncultured Solirubrobacteraceae bacterium]